MVIELLSYNIFCNNLKGIKFKIAITKNCSNSVLHVKTIALVIQFFKKIVNGYLSLG